MRCYRPICAGQRRGARRIEGATGGLSGVLGGEDDLAGVGALDDGGEAFGGIS
jgi:hypothetical protein